MGKYSSDQPVKRGSVKDLFFSGSSGKSGRHSQHKQLSAASVLAAGNSRSPVLAAIAVPTAAIAAVAVAGVVGAPETASADSSVVAQQTPELTESERTQEPVETLDPEDSAAVREARQASKEQAKAGKAELTSPEPEPEKSDSGSGGASAQSDAGKGVSSKSSGGMTSPAENRAYAKSILPAGDFKCADELVMRESGWKTNATNPSSGAYGVPQSLPASKLASEGADWRTNGKTQFNWMIKYVKTRYGGFCGALSHSHTNGWY